MNLHFQGFYPREISLVIIGLILTVSFPIVEATDLSDFNLSNYLIKPTPEDHIGIITTDKSVYYIGDDANAILAYGVIPTDMPICPSPYGCEGYGPSIGIYDPNGNRKITLQHVPYPYDGALKVEDRNFWSSINRFGPLIAGCWELKLYSGVHLSGTLLDTRSFLVTESGNEVTELCEEEPPLDSQPTVDITSPVDGSSYAGGTTITFTGTATDLEDGVLDVSLTWTSDIDGYIGAGGFFAKSISVGIHNITASVADSFGNTAYHSHIITITPVDAIPTISIISPINGSSFVEGTTITFIGTATDLEDGDLTASLFWWSDLGGGLVGTGGSFVNSSLPVGTHFITATAQDSASQTGSSMHIITVTPVVVDNPPTVNIVTPSDGESIINGTLVTFSATATDLEDGDLAENLKWYSDLDGFFGASGSFLYDITSLSIGIHTITANVTDSATNTNSDYITITITEDSYTMIQICHIPPDNPDNPQTISISESAWPDHEMHGDTLGECNDNIIEINPNDDPKPEDESTKTKKEHKKEIIIEEIKKQKENARKKSELNSYRDDFNKIKTELKLFKEQGKNTDSLSSKIKSIISDFQKTLKILTAEFEYDKEYKSELRAELKEKNKALYEKMTKSEQVFNSKVSSKLSELSQSIDPAKTAKDLGLDYKNGKTTITISLTNVNQNILDNLGSIGRIDAVADNYVQLTVNLKNLKDLGSVPGVKSITPSYSAVQSTIQKSENGDRELGSVDLLNEVFTSIQGHFRGIFS